MKIGFVVVLRGGMTSPAPAPGYTAVREMALHAEALGFDSLWLYDHLLYRFPGHPTVGIWECWTVLAALAEATHRVELGTLVLCNQFRNPRPGGKNGEHLGGSESRAVDPGDRGGVERSGV